ncbi:hypothetical protein [Streptomyces aurantiogriseus]|uniref:Uncharacterized protein n=1 Tax=Streptomyces aurantiogriseus TaxID=66870 RepID=A0A918KWM2_9ACTN|nr:hypothetical protein [Streptomyces aurantiogriseus]GGR37843.1 hypothetical protein GCM10010251_62860 [Streptomyces aurantiogriseus]
MDTNELLALLVRHRAELRQWLDDEQYQHFLTRLERLRAAGTDPDRAARAMTAVLRSLWPVPKDAGDLAKALRSGERAVAAAPTAPSEEAVLAALEALYAAPSAEVAGSGGVTGRQPGGPATPGVGVVGEGGDLAAPSVGETADPVAAVLAAARRRLLAVPSRAAAPAGSPGAGASPADVIVLGDPEDPGAGLRSPEFQFDPDTGRPLDVVVRINRILLADRDPWGAADWWLGGNAWLGGAPASLIGRVPDERLADAALALVEED